MCVGVVGCECLCVFDLVCRGRLQLAVLPRCRVTRRVISRPVHRCNCPFLHAASCLPSPSSPPLPPHLPQERLGLSHLVGTPLLRAYMHGFFLDNRLYGKAKAIAEPFAYDAYRAKRVAAKLEEERRSRISLVKKLPRVGAAGRRVPGACLLVARLPAGRSLGHACVGGGSQSTACPAARMWFSWAKARGV